MTIKQCRAAVGAAPHLQQGVVRQHGRRDDKIFLGVLGNADDADLVAITGPAAGNVFERDPVVRDVDKGHVVPRAQEANKIRFLTSFLLLNRMAQTGRSAVAIDGCVFPEPRFKHLAVLCADRRRQEIVGERKQRHGAECEDERVPESQPDADVSAGAVKQVEGHNRLLGSCGSSPGRDPPCCAAGGSARPQRLSADQN